MIPAANAIRSLLPDLNNPATAQNWPASTVQFTFSNTISAGSRKEGTATPCISKAGTGAAEVSAMCNPLRNQIHDDEKRFQHRTAHDALPHGPDRGSRHFADG